jgi:vacuolar protein sorting-associated protein 52
MNTKLENRKVVEKLLGPSVEDLSLSPAVVRKISDGTVDEAWIRALAELEKRHNAVEIKKKEHQTPLKAMEDLVPLLENLTNRVGLALLKESETDACRLLSEYGTTSWRRSKPYVRLA